MSGHPDSPPDWPAPDDIQRFERSLDGFAIPPPRLKFQDRRWVHLVLLLLTVATTWLVQGSLAYSLTILLILGSHEMGHYLACRYYQVDASLPFFLPAPVLTGTLGAFIRIREPIPTKRMLFDIGAAGPFAGFLVALPALFLGVSTSAIQPLSAASEYQLSLGEPLLFKGVAWLLWGPIPDDATLVISPVGFAAWFGLLATALNLFPVGQLDGGHITYAVLGRKSTLITIVMLGISIGLTIFASRSWAVWTILLTVMVFMLGPRHPRTIDEDIPLDRTRVVLAVLALLMLVVCFTYEPIELVDLVGSQ